MNRTDKMIDVAKAVMVVALGLCLVTGSWWMVLGVSFVIAGTLAK